VSVEGNEAIRQSLAWRKEHLQYELAQLYKQKEKIEKQIRVREHVLQYITRELKKLETV